MNYIIPQNFIIMTEDGRELLRINLKTGEVTGKIEDASEAGRELPRGY